jgi:hypothetical protein
MPNIKNPTSFSEAFAINPTDLRKLGVLDPVLNVDTRLFIDPLLLADSKHKEINKGAVASYKRHFTRLVGLLAGSKYEGDMGWRTANRLLDFPEVKGTCLGYGAASIAGRSWGSTLRKKVLRAAKETVDLGITDPDLFLVIALLEDGVGPDLISDMTTNIILSDLAAFTGRVCKTLRVKTQPFIFADGTSVRFPINPLAKDRPAPVILVPLDVLRELPIVNSWVDVGRAAATNSMLRARVNKLIGAIWEASVQKKKDALRKDVYSSKAAFEVMLDVVREVPKIAYDASADPEGLLAWLRIAHTAVAQHPLHLSHARRPSIDEVQNVVTAIVDHYRELVENKGLWKELWTGTKPRPEKSAQRMFFAIADAHCKANDLDITPEADSGSGPVDFKVSSSYRNRVLVEVKLSKNPKLVHGYEVQLATYKRAEGTMRATYMVIDVGQMGSKDTRITAIRRKAIKKGEPVSEITFISGKRQKSASVRN